MRKTFASEGSGTAGETGKREIFFFISTKPTAAMAKTPLVHFVNRAAAKRRHHRDGSGGSNLPRSEKKTRSDGLSLR
jgi:hypothetical protein